MRSSPSVAGIQSVGAADLSTDASGEQLGVQVDEARSEERRVGKECRL